MPRYFLHVKDGSDLLEDPDGQEFDDVAAARCEAVKAARELMAEDLRTGEPLALHRAIAIADETGNTVLELSFRDALPVRNSSNTSQ